MEYINLILGLGLTIAFTWLLIRNSERKGFINALSRFDTIVGIVGGVYLVVTSTYWLLVH